MSTCLGLLRFLWRRLGSEKTTLPSVVSLSLRFGNAGSGFWGPGVLERGLVGKASRAEGKALRAEQVRAVNPFVGFHGDCRQEP